MVCHEDSARNMWTYFENKQTKREYANYIFAREQLYSNNFTRDVKLSDWLRDMELQKRELQHYGKMISDEEFAEILLGNVSRTHRDVVRQFSRHYAVLALPGAHQLAPTVAQVMNALLLRKILMNRSLRKCLGNAGKGKKQRGRGKYKAKKKTQDRNVQKSDGCWECGEHGHIKANCPNKKSGDDSSGQNASAGMESKRWQNKKGDDAKKAKKSVDALTQRKIGATVVGARRHKPSMVEWVLDTATDVHVCTNKELLTDRRTDWEHIFLDFDGQTKGDRMVGTLSLQVMNTVSHHEEVLTLANVVHTPKDMIIY
ncbi:hypothetical protein PPTG_02016 [Phytophthora nicotianae INRA-310]|uniref:CCHC-type domain-containing protein n=1 Tax=Phytophthora nicotianae (strain INRA-310) TaxID=761204 RepID=W2R961_PHYN3|nr:hypothetical protein PPTG_02016 [Phytophthora nicotianae INRA-310]ETN21948.1 hypothetical protein PPTG_02016 [Phytophthora nicotianae INRA-310]